MEDWPLRQTICGLAELELHSNAGVTAVVSILDPETPEPGVFARFAPHDRLTLRFHDISEPLPNTVLPEMAHIETLLDFAEKRTGKPQDHLLIHCHMGVSRSSAAAVALLLQARPDAPDELALAQVLRIRPQAWPNPRMIAFADSLLGRRGRLIAALAQFHKARGTA